MRRSRRHTYTANLDPELNVTSADPDFYRQFGRTASDICGRSLYDLLHPSAPAVIGRHFTRLAERRCNRFVERMVGLNGENPFSGELIGIAVHQSTDRLAGIVVMVQPDEEATDPASDESLGHRKPILSKLDALVLEGVASGASTVQLAARLYLSRQGVEYHVGLMLRKLKAPNRAALVARAHSMGMLTVGHWPPRVLPEFVK
ncbi:LuxR C-terminal-related transcriptional regulator [Streptantibioticus silvisoli]|nr:LuxR C-terminal-related transcriptional regulator [Streptantibioticus silvisoli]MDI5962993.1 LuxR C-terminal-related transcriptional regulator [Streptantibioticus silvisoli]